MASLCKNLRLARHGASYITRTFSLNRPLLTKPHLQQNSQSSSWAQFLAPRAFHNFAPEKGEFAHELMKKEPHYLVQIDSLSRFDKLEIDKIETGVFEAGGYKWKLNIYHGDKENKNVPVKLALADTSALPKNGQVDAVFSICLKNQIDGYYHYVLGRARFDATNAEFGDFVIPKHLFTDPSSGYLKNDTCVFGAEVFVNRNEVVTENMSLKNLKFPKYKTEFKITNIPTLKQGGGWVPKQTEPQTWTSEVFSVGGQDWMLEVCPSHLGPRVGWKNGKLSIFLRKIDVSVGDVNVSFVIYYPPKWVNMGECFCKKK